MGLKNKKLQCTRCGKRYKDSDLYIINGLCVCENCMEIPEKILVLEKYYSAARNIVFKLISDGIYLSDYNPAANSVVVLDGIDKLIPVFGADDNGNKQYQSITHNDCIFLQVCREGKR